MNTAAEGAAGRRASRRSRRTVRVVGDQLVMERFRILERIGSGGMGTVYRAFDERLQRQVAVKELRAVDPDRVMREAQAAARLNHPAIVTLYELGEHDGHAVLVSELVPGETLAELETAGELCDRDVARDRRRPLRGARPRSRPRRRPPRHQARERDRPRARRDRSSGRSSWTSGSPGSPAPPTLTAPGEVVGTLAYMSPEQAEGELAGPPSDVYSLALTAYECWAGSNPVAGATPAETARRIGEPVPPLRLTRPDLPEGLADTIDACLEPEPELRPTPFELRDCVLAELNELDARHALPASHDDIDERLARASAPLATAKLACSSAVPWSSSLSSPARSAAPGLALVLAVFALPSLLIGATVAGARAVCAAPLLGAAGLGPAAAGLGAAAPTAPARAMLGARGLDLAVWRRRSLSGSEPTLASPPGSPRLDLRRLACRRLDPAPPGRTRLPPRRRNLRPRRHAPRPVARAAPCIAGAARRDALGGWRQRRALIGRRRLPRRPPDRARRRRRTRCRDRVRRAPAAAALWAAGAPPADGSPGRFARGCLTACRRRVVFGPQPRRISRSPLRGSDPGCAWPRSQP